MRYFDSHFVFAYILNCSTLTKFQLSVWSSAMPKEKESIKKINTSKRGIAQWLPDYYYYVVSESLGNHLQNFRKTRHF